MDRFADGISVIEVLPLDVVVAPVEQYGIKQEEGGPYVVGRVCEDSAAFSPNERNQTSWNPCETLVKKTGQGTSEGCPNDARYSPVFKTLTPSEIKLLNARGAKREQNRLAQRRYRERQKQRTALLEQQVQELTQYAAKLQKDIDSLREATTGIRKVMAKGQAKREHRGHAADMNCK